MLYSSYSVVILVVSVIFPVLASIAIGLRFRSRKIKSLALKADDFTILSALIITFGLAILNIYGSVAGGFGKPTLQLTPSEAKEYFKELYATIHLTHSSLAVIKLSILLMYKRIFITPRFCLFANITMIVVFAWFSAFFIALFFSARPLSNYWNKGETALAYNYSAFLIAEPATDLAIDLWILCLPLPVIRGLHMSTKRKLQLVGIFWLGLFCVVAATVRLYYVYSYSTLTNAAKPAFSGVQYNNFVWAVIEPCASIVAACLPTLGPILNGWRLPESVVQRIRSALSVHSGRPGSRSRQHTTVDMSNEAAHHSRAAENGWMELPSDSATMVSGPRDLELSDLEPGRGN